MKNELIVARYTGQRKRAAAVRLHALLEQFGLQGLATERFARAPLPTEAAAEETLPG